MWNLFLLRDHRKNLTGIPWVLTTITAVLAGCGTIPVRTLSPEYETVFIKMSDNSSLEYGAEERLTESMVREFERDGRLRQTSSWDQADLILELNITEYDLTPVALDNDNRVAGRNLTVSVTAGARDRKTGVWVMPVSPFTATGQFFLSNVPSGRREDDVYRRLAEDILSRLIEGWG